MACTNVIFLELKYVDCVDVEDSEEEEGVAKVAEVVEVEEVGEEVDEEEVMEVATDNCFHLVAVESKSIPPEGFASLVAEIQVRVGVGEV